MRVHQILINVITNSIKYTDTGEIRVRLFMPDATHWTLQVSDTGVGIPKESLDHIFDPFWQMDDTKTRQAMLGVGLGLSIVKQLAELMRGEIKVVSEPEHGTVFTVTLPIKVPEKTAVRS
jgi:signal transduction histidine kinase